MSSSSTSSTTARSSSNKRKKNLETQATWFWLGSLVCLIIVSRNFSGLWTSTSTTTTTYTTREIFASQPQPILQGRYNDINFNNNAMILRQQQQENNLYPTNRGVTMIQEDENVQLVIAKNETNNTQDNRGEATVGVVVHKEEELVSSDDAIVAEELSLLEDQSLFQNQTNINTEVLFQNKTNMVNNATSTPLIQKDDAKIINTTKSLIQNQTNIKNNNNTTIMNHHVLPQWLEDYFVWHAEQRSKITPDNFQDFRYLIMACNGKCGGTTDRLRPLPFLLRMAYQSQRVFFIYWVKPAALEEFLLPPQGGMDWRLPLWLEAQTCVIPRTGLKQILQYTQSDHVLAVRTHFQSWNYGEHYYDEQAALSDEADDEPTAQQVFRSLWRRVFTPSPPVHQLVQEQYKKWQNIQPGQYASAHLRLLYARDSRPPHIIKEQTFNAMNCVSNLRPGGPFFVASDSDFAIEVALWYAQQQNVRVLVRSNNNTQEEPIHLDSRVRASPHPADYYDTFVDIYLIANTNCMAHGKGGFGQWGIIMGYNPHCSIDHNRQSCHWTDFAIDNNNTFQNQINPQIMESLFSEPMPPSNDTITKSSSSPVIVQQPSTQDIQNNTIDHPQEAATIITLSQDDGNVTTTTTKEDSIITVQKLQNVSNNFVHHLQPTYNDLTNINNNHTTTPLMLWNQSTILPNWLKDYFQWHHQQRNLMNESNWESFRFFIITCGHTKPVKKCGGTTDRLRPIPILLKVAATTTTFQRILLIDWHHPAPLEEFLLPPQGGMDWRLPPWLSQKLQNNTTVATGMKRIRRVSSKQHKPVVRVQYQSFNYGEEEYNQWRTEPNEPNVYQVFPHIWNILFTPSPPIAHRIQQTFQQLQLLPGQYATAHIRALFATESRPNYEIEKATLRAMDCLSQLRPGGPYLVASDSPIAIQKAIQYGTEKGVRVVSAAATATLNNSSSESDEPIHLDSIRRVSSNPTDYYDTFIDIYMIAHTNCITHGKGGFGQWGALLGYNQSCVSKFHQGTGCTWTNATTASPLANSLSNMMYNETILQQLFLPPMMTQQYNEPT